jgi:hypothetical protein
MVFDRITSVFRGETETTTNSKTSSSNTTPTDSSTSQDSTDEDESVGISRPPGWDSIYGTYEKPVFPKDNEVIDIIESLDKAADIADFSTYLPKLGTNTEHIQLEFYTITSSDGDRTLVIDVHISDFSEWLPEEKGDWEYPGDCLGNNGPYYMHLADEFQSIMRVPPFGFTLVEYNADEDVAIYSYERTLYPEREESVNR